jgi:6-phosphogluconolactonase
VTTPNSRINADTLIWTGSYTSDSGGQGEGIGAVVAKADGRLVPLGTAAEAASPSFLAVHPSLPIVYVVGEFTRTVQAYRRLGEFRLEPAGEPWPAGEAACHVAVDPAARFLVVACWGDGSVILYELDDDGGIARRLPSAPAKDPHSSTSADRTPSSDRTSRAHASLMLSDGRIMTTDLGFDIVRVWHYAPGEGLVSDHDIALPYGSGPRHLVQHPSGTVFVVTEYSIEIAVLQADQAGRFCLLGMGPATHGGAREGDSAAEIALSPDARFVYTGIRGSNRISTLKVEADGTRLVPLGDVPSGGKHPRHHLVRDGWLHVAHEHSHDLVTLPLDPATGLPGVPHSRIRIGSPTVLIMAG